MSIPRRLDEGLRVLLVVDDESKIRSAVSRILSREPYRVIALPSGEAALEFVRAGHRVDLLLTDVRMPEMDGAELGRRLARLRPHVPRIYMSGDPGGIALEPGAAYLAKPFVPAELLRLLEEQLG